MILLLLLVSYPYPDVGSHFARLSEQGSRGSLLLLSLQFAALSISFSVLKTCAHGYVNCYLPRASQG